MEDVASLSQTPGDGIEEPQEDGQHATLEIDAVDRWAECAGVLACDESKDIDDVEESKHAEGEETPLVTGRDEGADETGDDHDLIHEDGDEDGRPWEASRQGEIQEQQWCGDDPVNVTDIEDLTGVSKGSSTWRAQELDGDGSLTKVGTHGKVGYRSHEGNGRGDIVEDAMRARFRETQTHEDERGQGHDRADGEVPATI